jgi:pilus assembly protein CpaB
MRRLTPAGVSTIMVAVVGLFVTAYFAKLMRAAEPHSQPTTQLQAGEFRNVPTAAGTIEPGTVIASAHLVSGRIQADAVAPDAVSQERTLIGRVAKERITQGSAIRAAQLFPPGERPQPSVSRGMRAVSIALARGLAPVTGLFKEGQYVDVYLTPRSDVSNDGRLRGGMTLTLFRGVRLLAATPIESANSAEYVATLELTPEQATALILAREKGTIALSFNPEGKGDGGIALKNRDRATFDEILGMPAVPAPPTPNAGGTFTTEVYRGTTRSIRQFDEQTKIQPPQAKSTRANPWQSAPLWTRKSPAGSMSPQAPDRVAAVPNQTAVK